MEIGIDIGSSITKNSKLLQFESKVSFLDSFNKTDTMTIDDEEYFIGIGEYDSNYRKVERKNLLPLLYGSLALSSNDIFNKVVLGLPISQYKADKEKLKNIIMNNDEKNIVINGKGKRLVIQDVEVVPEGVLTVDTNNDCILVDIGGRTTDIALIETINRRRKVNNPLSIPIGIQNLKSNYIKTINARESLDLRDNDFDRIVRNGLKIYGVSRSTDYAKDIFRDFATTLIKKLEIEYPLKTHDLRITGGGGMMLFKSLKKRLNHAKLINNSLYANAIAFENYRRNIWR